MWNHKRQWCLLAIMLLGAMGQSRADVTLVADGKPQAVIVTASNAPAVVLYAAKELQYHVQQASGVEIPIVSEEIVSKWYNVSKQPTARVYLGDCRVTRDLGVDSAALAPEACLVRMRDGAVFVAGRDTHGDPLDRNVWAGTLFGVYELLEESLGVRWLWPGELGQVIPKSDTITVKDSNRIVEPHFIQRWIRTTQTWHAGRQEEQVWLRRHRMGYSRDLYVPHAFCHWWKRCGKEHPEYFNLLPNGKREPIGIPSDVSMCVSEPRLWRQIVKNWQKLPDESPGVRPPINCTENDGVALCTCQRCRAWDAPNAKERTGEGYTYLSPLSDRYAKFWLAVQQEACKIDPEVTVITLAYANYTEPPVATKLNDHIIVGIVAHLPFPETAESLAKNRQILSGWAATGARIFLRPNYFLQGYCMPYIFAPTFGRQFRFAAQHGMIGTDFDSLTGMYATQGPNLYLLARMHVRPLDEPDRLLKEYYNGFGPAAQQVQNYFDYWAGISEKVARRLPSWPYWPQAVDTLYSAEDFACGHDLLRAAAAACQGDQVALARVKFLEKGLKNVRLSVEVAQAIAQEKESGETVKQRKAISELAEFRETIERDYVANLAFCRWQESIAGWNWALRSSALKVEEIITALPLRWNLKWDPQEIGRDQGWYAPDFDSSDWLTVRTNDPWEKQEVGQEWKKQHGQDYNGLAWYRVSFNLSPEAAGKRLFLWFGAVDEGASVWLNGRMVGERPFRKESDWFTPFEMEITRQAYLDRPNVLVVLVEDRTGLGGVWKKAFVVTHLADPAELQPAKDLTDTGKEDSNTLLLLHFDEGRGNSTADAIGNVGAGEIVGATWTTAGKFGNALSFDGDDYVNFGEVFDLGSDDFTLEAWIKTISANTCGTIIAKHDAGNTGFRFNVSPSGAIGFIIRNAYASTGGQTATTPVNDGQWHHVALTRAGSTVRIYVDGVLDGTFNNGNADVNTANPLVIGAVYAGGAPLKGEFFNGLIDEVRISNKVRSFSEIKP